MLSRLWDVLWMARLAAKIGGGPGSEVPFQVAIWGHGEVTLELSIRELADGPYVLIAMPSHFAFLVVEQGRLRAEKTAKAPSSSQIKGSVGGGIEGVALPEPVAFPVTGYCNNEAFRRGLGANCYVIGHRYPIAGPLVIFGVTSDGLQHSIQELVNAPLHRQGSNEPDPSFPVPGQPRVPLR